MRLPFCTYRVVEFIIDDTTYYAVKRRLFGFIPHGYSDLRDDPHKHYWTPLAENFNKWCLNKDLTEVYNRQKMLVEPNTGKPSVQIRVLSNKELEMKLAENKLGGKASW